VVVAADLLADATNRADERVVLSGINFAAQVVDVYVHYVGDGIAVNSPDCFDDCGSRNGVPGIPQQEFQQRAYSLGLSSTARPARRTSCETRFTSKSSNENRAAFSRLPG
jgi:hypothetical protein